MAEPAAALELEGLGFGFGRGRVLEDVSLAVGPGEFFSLLGPSGGGKTTLLRLVGGYLEPTAGRVRIHGRDVTGVPPEGRRVGMVFQHYALFPHLTARDNVAFGLEMARVPRDERARRVEEMLDRVGLSAAERGRRPARLSGGQQQRVALARALVIEPALLLLDEPLANLDRPLREQLRAGLKELQRRSGVTTVLVTHDREEALQLADRVGVLAAGRLLQTGPPEAVYRRPCCPLVARLLGEANLLTVRQVAADGVRLDGDLTLALDDSAGRPEVGRPVLLRPEVLELAPADAAGWPGRVKTCAFLGSDQVVEIETAGGVVLKVRARPGVAIPGTGEAVRVLARPDAAWVLPEDDLEGTDDGAL